MKKPQFSVLIAVTVLFAVFTLGFFLGRNQNHDSVQLSVPASMQTAPAVTAGSADTQPTTDSAAGYPVNINTAALPDLMTLPEIGLVLAQRILDYREAHGSFQAVEELMNVEGIGEKRMEQLLDLVTIGG